MKLSKEILSNQILELYKELGKIPSVKEYDKKYKNRSEAVKRYFGTWNKAMFSIFGKVKHASPVPKQEVTCNNCSINFFKVSSQIKHSNNFCSKSCAATFNNKNKKHGSRRSKLEVWLEQELVRIYPNLVFQFNSKEAIGSELDIYIPSLKLAFELNGIFHYEPIFGDKKLDQIQVNDQNKFQACQVNGISLCVIDVSKLVYFKPINAQSFLDIISDIVSGLYKIT